MSDSPYDPNALYNYWIARENAYYDYLMYWQMEEQRQDIQPKRENTQPSPPAAPVTPVKKRKLPPAAKSDMYKTRMCRNYMETGKCKYGRVCQFAHGMKELIKYSLCVCFDHVEQRQQYMLFLVRGHLIIVLLTGMTALTEDEDISETIMLKPLPLVVRRASQSANTNTSNNAPFTLSAAALALVVRPLVYLEEVTYIGKILRFPQNSKLKF